MLGCSRSALWATQAVPVSFTLAPGPAVEKLLDEVLGLFLHYRFGGGNVRAKLHPVEPPRCLLAWQFRHSPLLPGEGV